MPVMLPVLMSESLMNVPGVTELLNPVMVPSVFVAVQVNNVPETFDVSVMFVLVFEHIGAFGAVVNNGTG